MQSRLRLAAAYQCHPIPDAQVQQTLKRGSALKRALAGFFLAVSGAYVRARRTVQGLSLEYAVQPRPMLACLWAAVVAAVLAPLHK